MTIFSRSTLKAAFPNNPRAVAEFERLDSLLSAVDGNGQSISDKLDAILSAGGGSFQPAHPILDALTKLEPGKIGIVEVKEDGSAAIREVDSLDPASLLTRGVAYTVLTGFVGMGTTAERPATPPNAGGIYIDTTIDVDGYAIIWNGSYWVNFQGFRV